MEQRRIIGIVLLILSGLLFLVSAITVIIKMPMGGEKVALLLTTLLPQLIVLAVLAYSILRPRRFDPSDFDPNDKWKNAWRPNKKNHNAIDPDGYSFIATGCLCLFISIAFSASSLIAIGINPYANTVTNIVTIALFVLTFLAAMWAAYKSAMSIYRTHYKK